MDGRSLVIEGDFGLGHDNKINQRVGLEKYDQDEVSSSFSVRVGSSLDVLDYAWA